MGSLLLLLIYAFLVVTIPAGTLLLSWILGSKDPDTPLTVPFESGIEVTDSARSLLNQWIYNS